MQSKTDDVFLVGWLGFLLLFFHVLGTELSPVDNSVVSEIKEIALNLPPRLTFTPTPQV